MQVDDRSSTPTPSIARCIATLEGHEERVWHCAWSRDGRQLASCGSDRTVRLWRRTGDAFVTSASLDDAHDRTVRRVAWAPCGTLLAATSFDATCCVWRRSRQDDAWEILATLEGHGTGQRSVTQRLLSTFSASSSAAESSRPLHAIDAPSARYRIDGVESLRLRPRPAQAARGTRPLPY